MRHSIRMKIFVGFSTLILAFSICISGIILTITSLELTQRTRTDAIYQSEMVIKDIDDYLQEMKNSYISCATDRNLFTEIKSATGLQSSYSYTLNLFRTFAYNSKYLHSIYLYDINNEQLANSEFSNTGLLGHHSWLNNEAYQQASFYFFYDSESDSGEGKDNNIMAYVGPLKFNYLGETIAYISVNVMLTDMKERLYPQTSAGTKQYILDDSSNVIFENGISEGIQQCLDGITEDGSTTCKVDNISYLVICSTSSNFKWKFVRMMPVSEVYGDIYHMALLLLAVTLVFILIGMLLSYIMTRSFTKPVYILKSMMSAYRSNKPGYNLISSKAFHRNDDFRELFESYDEMVSRMDYLIDEVYRANLVKKEMEIRMLQVGINPHFIYNVLDSINWIMKMGKYEKAEEVLPLFSTYLRNTLSFHRDSITIRELRNQIKNYCQLQKFFSDDRIEYQITFEEGMLDCKVMTLILQPIVENAYMHGFKNKKTSGQIIISGMFSGETAIFTVCDDGIGMSEERLEKLRQAVQDDENWEDDQFFGLRSVARRLRYAYGGVCGLEIESVVGEGTCVKIKTKILV